MNNFLDFLLLGVVVVSVSAAITAVILALAYFASYGACASAAKTMEVEFKHQFFVGCFIKVDGRFVPLSSYRVR